jgi:hypothetical protein
MVCTFVSVVELVSVVKFSAIFLERKFQVDVPDWNWVKNVQSFLN